MKRSLLSCLLLFLTLSTLVSAETREWKDRQGRKITAEFVSYDGAKVTLKLASGKTTSIPSAKLSDEDNQFLKDQPGNTPGKTGSQGDLDPENFDSPWPKDVKTVENFKVEIIKEGPEEFIYESPHFRFICTARLGVQLIKDVGRMFEATFDANKAIPIANKPTRKEGIKFPIYLYEKKEDYIAAGGPVGSAGVQMGSTDPNEPYGKILVPAESIGVKLVSKNFRVDRTGEPKTLIHEITHQLMGREVRQASWFIEGTAEYVGLTPYRTGRFSFSGTHGGIVAGVTAYGKENKRGRALGKEIQIPYSLEEYMNMPYDQFTGSNANMNYGIAPLIVYYFYHADGNKDGEKIKKYVKALQSGTPEKEAQKILLGNRSWKELQTDIYKFWRKDIVLEFKEPDDQK